MDNKTAAAQTANPGATIPFEAAPVLNPDPAELVDWGEPALLLVVLRPAGVVVVEVSPSSDVVVVTGVRVRTAVGVENCGLASQNVWRREIRV